MNSRLQIEGDVGGCPVKATLTASAATGIPTPNVAPNAAYAGTLTTRGSNTAGTITAAGHTIATGNTADLYWSGGRRYGVTVGTVSGNDIPFTSGAGDNLPLANEEITICKIVTLDIDYAGAKLKAFSVTCKSRAQVVCRTSAPAVTLAIEIDPATAGKEAYFWVNNLFTNPFGSDVISTISISSEQTTVADNVNIGVLYASDT